MALRFGSKPGCWERHLQRKHGNPLFAQGREVSQAEVDEARRRDDSEISRFAEDFRDLLNKAAALEPNVETDVVLELKEGIERLYEQCAGLGGEHQAERQALLKLNEVVMRTIRSAAGEDPLAMQELQTEEAARQVHLELLQHPLIAHLLRSDSPVAPDELVPTLLSEDVQTVRLAMTLFDAPQQAQLRAEAQALLQGLGDAAPPAAKAAFEAMQSKLQ